MKHNMKLNNGPYNSICYGQKDIEMRLYDEKRKLINIGDIITFTNIDTLDCFDVKVINLYICKNFDELYKKFDRVRLGYNDLDDKYNPEDMERYYSREDINKYGVVGIEIKKI